MSLNKTASKKSGKKWIDTPGIKLIQELILQAKTEEDVQEVLDFLKELSEKEEMGKAKNTGDQTEVVNNTPEGYYIAIVEGSYGGDGTPWGYGGIRDFVFINNTNKSVTIGINTTGHLSTDEGIVDSVTDKSELKKKVGPYSYTSLDSMDWEGYIEYNSAIEINIEENSYYINQRRIIRSKIALNDDFKASLKTLPIIKKPGIMYDIADIESV